MLYNIEEGKGEGISLTFYVEKEKTKKTLIQARTCEISFPLSPLIHNIYTSQTIFLINEIIFFLHIIVYMNISGELIIGLSSIFCTSVGVVLAYVFKIKCSEMSLCYCFRCKRIVAGENEMYQLENEHQTHLVEDHIPSPTLSR
jgi:hypothetical protein